MITVVFLPPFNSPIEGQQKDNMNSITGLLFILLVCKGVTASGGNGTFYDKDRYTINIVII